MTLSYDSKLAQLAPLSFFANIHQVGLPSLYGIKVQDMEYYLSFALVIIFFQLCVDVFIHGVLELFHGWKIYDYLVSPVRSLSAFRVQNHALFKGVFHTILGHSVGQFAHPGQVQILLFTSHLGLRKKEVYNIWLPTRYAGNLYKYPLADHICVRQRCISTWSTTKRMRVKCVPIFIFGRRPNTGRSTLYKYLVGDQNIC